MVRGLEIQVDPNNPFLDIHRGRGTGSCTFAEQYSCICSCAGIAHAQLLRFALLPGYEKELPSKYIHALQAKEKTAQQAIHDLSPSFHKMAKKPITSFFLTKKTAHALIEHCRSVDIPHYTKANPSFQKIINHLSADIQTITVEDWKHLAPRAGSYISRPHILCDIISAILIAVKTNTPQESTLEQITSVTIRIYLESRGQSKGFTPSRTTKNSSLILKQNTRMMCDSQEYKNKYTNGESLTPEIIKNTIRKILEKFMILLDKYDMEQINPPLRCLGILFCLDPSAHIRVWNDCLQPIFQSDICAPLRQEIDAATKHVMKLARYDIWDDGTPARWTEPTRPSFD